MTMAEDEALKRNCHFADEDTLSFQAIGFYNKLGYSEYACLGNFVMRFRGIIYLRFYAHKDAFPCMQQMHLIMLLQ